VVGVGGNWGFEGADTAFEVDVVVQLEKSLAGGGWDIPSLGAEKELVDDVVVVAVL